MKRVRYARPGPQPHVPPDRTPLFHFGQTVRLKRGLGRAHEPYVGRIEVMYADYWAAVGSFIVPPNWFELQETASAR